MSRKSSTEPKPARKTSRKRTTDRRVRHTRDALGDALVAIMHEKPFDDITVQHVLDRAGVGRSTFYTYFRDKDDLFLSDVEDFLEAMAFALSHQGEVSNRVAPVREMFAHVAEWHEFSKALIAAGKFHDFVELAQGYFARGIEQRLAELPRARGIPTAQRAALAQMFAGAMLSLMTWWMNHGRPVSPKEMDQLYHQMVWAGIGGTDTR
jgi:AcrR family transcriptional regulator